MAKQNTINVVNFGDLSFDNPVDILSRMEKIKSLSLEVKDEETSLTLQLELNALAKAFTKLILEGFNCSDEAIKELIQNKFGSNSGYSININNISYSYSKEQVSKPEIDKAYLKSIGYNNQTEYGRHLEANNLPLPEGLVKEIMFKFKPDVWKGDPIAHVVYSDVINIKEKEIKIKK